MKIDPNLVAEGVELATELKHQQWRFGLWALRCEPVGESGENTGAYGRLTAHMHEVYEATGDTVPTVETVKKWRQVVAAWAGSGSGPESPPHSSWSVLQILASHPDRHNLLKKSPRGGWNKANATEALRKHLMGNQLQETLKRLEEERQEQIQDILDKINELESKLGKVEEKDVDRAAARQVKQEIDEQFFALVDTLDEEQEDSTVEEVMRALPDVRRMVKDTTRYQMQEATKVCLEALKRLKEQGMEPLEANQFLRIEQGLDAVERFLATAREALNEQKAKVL